MTHILIVEHDSKLAAQAEKACGALGYTSEVVSDMTAALEAIDSGIFDGVFGALLCLPGERAGFMQLAAHGTGMFLMSHLLTNSVPFVLTAPYSYLEKATRKDTALSEYVEHKDVCGWDDTDSTQSPYGQHNLLILAHGIESRAAEQT